MGDVRVELGPPAIGELQRLIFDSTKKILFVTGAGISVKSGVPLYRSQGIVKSDKQSTTTSASSSVPLSITDSQKPAASPPLLSSEPNAAELQGKSMSLESRVITASDNKLVFAPPSVVRQAVPNETAFRKRFGPILWRDDGSNPPLDLSPDEVGVPPYRSPDRSTRAAGKDVRRGSSKSESSTNAKAIWDVNLWRIAQKSAFLRDPSEWYLGFWFSTHHVNDFLKAEPNESHYVIGALCAKFPDRIKCVTQNVDYLHVKAGCPKNCLIEVHGRIGLYRCSQQDCVYGHEKLITWNELYVGDSSESGTITPSDGFEKSKSRQKRMDHERKKEFKLPKCPKCFAPAMPLTLLFDEIYTTHSFFQYGKCKKWFSECDVMIFIGTSFNVTVTSTALDNAVKRHCYIWNINTVRDSDFFSSLTEVPVDQPFDFFNEQETPKHKSNILWCLSAEESALSPFGSSRPCRSGPSVVRQLVGTADKILMQLVPSNWQKMIFEKMTENEKKKDLLAFKGSDESERPVFQIDDKGN